MYLLPYLICIYNQICKKQTFFMIFYSIAFPEKQLFHLLPFFSTYLHVFHDYKYLSNNPKNCCLAIHTHCVILDQKQFDYIEEPLDPWTEFNKWKETQLKLKIKQDHVFHKCSNNGEVGVY